MSKRLPLIERDLDASIALKLPVDGGDFSSIKVSAFLDRALMLAYAMDAALGSGGPIVNFCQNRIHFALIFAASLISGRTSLFPPNRTPAMQRALAEAYPGATVISDCAMVPTPELGHLRYVELAQSHPLQVLHTDIPDIPADFVAARCFTSGSTGQPKPINKTWSTFYHSTAINHQAMLGDGEANLLHQVATVPGQHMWGLETTILLPWQAPVVMSSVHPLFPADIAAALAAIPASRMLVTTPAHLRAMVKCEIEFPKVERILCATAPLSESLAKEAESRFGGSLVEVYGCSEVGSMARRKTARETPWTPFEGLNFSVSDSGKAEVDAGHLDAPVTLQDRLVLEESFRFHLAGRAEDLVNVGGKRASLSELNAILLAHPEVKDGVIIADPGETRDRLTAVVVATDNCNKTTLTTFFREHVDPVFVPRPIYFVPSLPRASNGKLPRASLLRLLDELADSF